MLMMIITIQNVISSDLMLIRNIEKMQCLGNGFPCMAESQVAFIKEKIHFWFKLFLVSTLTYLVLLVP